METTDLINPGTAQSASDADKGQASVSPTDIKGQQGSVSPTGQDVDEDGKPLPFGEHPKWKSARQAEKKLTEALKANGLEDFDELLALAESGKLVHGKITDPAQIETLMAKAAKLDGYEAYWAQQAEIEKRKTEEPDETVARIARENAELKKQLAAKESAEDGAKALQTYQSEVTAQLRAVLPNTPAEDVPFLLEFFGINNPFAEIDITDKLAIARMVKGGAKKIEAFKQQVIKNYLEGKEQIPTITKGADTAPVVKGIKSLKDARRAMIAAYST